ncbi:MAG: hypothetical protein A2W33_06915 [Chloroflexi bacterium RBG_16_52_11]|nr:MAG: hypothetical protein A2W33_06915 [Chloroflexi bacterium RBG_16_52_11]
MDTKSAPSRTQASHPNSVALILTFFAINALFIYLIYSKNLIFGSIPGNWDYPFFKTLTSIPLWIPIIVFLLLGLSVTTGSKLVHSHEKMVLFGWLLIAGVIQFLIRRIYPYTLGEIVQSDMANSFYTTAMRYSPLEILSQFSDLAPSLPLHARSNMPGKILLFQLFNIFTSSPQRMGYLVIVLSTIGALLLYGICKRLFHDRQIAFYALILYALIPCKLFFFPILNTVTPVFILLCLYLFLLYITRKQLLFLLLLGGVLYAQVLFEPTPLVTGIIFVGILINAIGEGRISKKEIWAVLIIPALGFLGVHVLFLLFFSFNLFEAFQYVLKDAVNFNLIDKRDYWIWIGENPKEFFFSAGIPVMILFIYLTSHLISQLRTLQYNLTRWSIENIVILSLSVTFGVVLFLGINRGEITRLWIYLAVFFQIPAASYLAKIEHSKVVFFFIACTLVVQSILTLQRVGFVIP